MSPFTADPRASIAAWGELRLIEHVTRWLGRASPRSPAGIGDDCAVMTGSPRQQLITVDPVIHGEHFDDTVPPAGVGEKLFKRNLSDIAAMGGRPRAAVVALALDSRVSMRWLGAFYRGLAKVSLEYRVPIIGGDIARHQDGFVATMTVVGEASGERVLTRTGARRGDCIYVSGTLGGSILGHHFRFRPRLKEGAWLASRPEVRSLMDVSDGIAKDLLALTPGGLRPRMRADAVPISPAARRLAQRSGHPALEHALTDGEDYELLFVVDGRADPAAFEQAWKRRFTTRLTCLGSFVRQNERPTSGEVDLSRYHGYEHLR